MLLSFDVVLDALVSVENHIKGVSLDVPYGTKRESLESTKKLFLKWLGIYRAYANGYSQELLPRTQRYTIRMLSSFADDLDNQVRDIFEARIASESYLLVSNLFKSFSRIPQPCFVLAEHREFRQTSIATLLNDKLKNLTVPRPVIGTASVDVTIRDIQNKDIIVICYDSGQFDNVFAWPLLLHEAFHFIYESERLDRLAKDCPKVSWLEEALIDMYIINYFGPAYALSLATYLQRFPHERTVSHPSFTSRIFIALQYLKRTQEEKRLPSPVNDHIADIFDYLKGVWDQHKEADPLEVQEQVAKIYDSAEKDLNRMISEKAQPFADFLRQNERKRQEVFQKGGFEYIENQVLSVGDVTEYFRAGIPAAADPRIVFNSFISRQGREMINDPKAHIFVKESLKKWHLKNAWVEAKVHGHRST